MREIDKLNNTELEVEENLEVFDEMDIEENLEDFDELYEDEIYEDSQELTGFKKLRRKFYNLSTAKKVQAIVASALTLILVIMIPIFGWFALNKKIEAFTKVKEPDNLDIRAGHYDSVQYFNLNDIDIEAVATGAPHKVVFSVSAGDYKIPYQIQLAHTTNIPFEYKIYKATEWKGTNPPSNPDVTYISMPLKEQGEDAVDYTFYYTKGQEIELNTKNPDGSTYGRELALRSGNYYNDTYDAGDKPEIYAVPIYEQSGRITTDVTSEHDYFILEITWDNTATTTGNFSEWNVAENKKETDMIYLTASRYTQ